MHNLYLKILFGVCKIEHNYLRRCVMCCHWDLNPDNWCRWPNLATVDSTLDLEKV